jgi:hypothetical protein
VAWWIRAASIEQHTASSECRPRSRSQAANGSHTPSAATATCPEGVTLPCNPEMDIVEFAKIVAGVCRETVRVLMAEVAIDDCRMLLTLHPAATNLLSTEQEKARADTQA